MFNNDWKNDVLLVDASGAITAAFQEVFGVPRVRIMFFSRDSESGKTFMASGSICSLPGEVA